MFSRPGWSQGLLYKHPCHWLTDWLSHPLVQIYLRRRHAQTVTNGASSHKTNYIDIFSEFLNLERHLNHCIGSKVTSIFLNGWILPKVEWHREGSALQLAQQAFLNKCKRNLAIFWHFQPFPDISSHLQSFAVIFRNLKPKKIPAVSCISSLVYSFWTTVKVFPAISNHF